MDDASQIPKNAVLTRTTDVFDNQSVPAGLLRAHRVAKNNWGRLVVHAGSIRFVFEDEPEHAITVTATDTIVIPPGRLHHVELDGPVEFVVEFYQRPKIAEA